MSINSGIRLTKVDINLIVSTKIWARLIADQLNIATAFHQLVLVLGKVVASRTLQATVLEIELIERLVRIDSWLV